MTYVAVPFLCYLLCGHLYSSVVCFVCIHTVHRPLSGLLYTHVLIHVTIYMRAIYNYTISCVNCCYLCLVQMYIHTITLYDDMLCISTLIYINTECFSKISVAHACVWIVCSWTCDLCTQLYSTHFDIGTVSSVFMNP